MHPYLLHQLLENATQIFPNNPALVDSTSNITYAELQSQSNELANRLKRMGVRQGDRVAILMQKSVCSIISLFSVLKTGAIYVPIDHNGPSTRSEYILDSCKTSWVITSDKILNMHDYIRDRGRNVYVFGDDSDVLSEGDNFHTYPSLRKTKTGSGLNFKLENVSDSSPAYILHTSGSTGSPKGVVISHHNALTFVNMAAEFFNIDSTDRFCNQAPLHFDLSVFDIFVSLKCGASTYILPEGYAVFPIKILDFIQTNNITIWNSVSSVLTSLVIHGSVAERTLESVRLVHFSGDLMPVKHLRLLMKLIKNAQFYNIYGQTEANSSMFYLVTAPLPSDDSWRIPIGRPFPNFEVITLDENDKLIETPGQEGELVICSSSVALGYWGDEGKTAAKFIPDPRFSINNKFAYRTGDMVKIDATGSYTYCGRKDHMIKCRGYRIELDEIELVLAGHPRIKTAVTIPVPNEVFGNTIMAVIVPTDTLSKDELIRYLLQKLPKYMIPDVIEFRSSIPTTSSGKIDRKELKSQLHAFSTIHM